MNSVGPGLSKASSGLPGEQVAEPESVLIPPPSLLVENGMKLTFSHRVPRAPSQYEKGLRLSFPFPALLTFSLTRLPSFSFFPPPQHWPLLGWEAELSWLMLSQLIPPLAIIKWQPVLSCMFLSNRHTSCPLLSFVSSFSNLGGKFSKKRTPAFSDFQAMEARKLTMVAFSVSQNDD